MSLLKAFIEQVAEEDDGTFAEATKEFAGRVAAQAVEVERGRVLVRKTLYDPLYTELDKRENERSELYGTKADLIVNVKKLEETMFDNHKCTLVELSPDYWKNYAMLIASIAQHPGYMLQTMKNLLWMLSDNVQCEDILKRTIDLNAKYHDKGAKKRTLDEMDLAPEVLPEDQPAIKDHALLRDAAKKLKAKHDAEVKSVAAELVEEMKKEQKEEEKEEAASA